MHIDKPVEYEVFTKQQAVIAVVVMALLLVGVSTSTFVEWKETGKIINDNAPAFLLLGPVLLLAIGMFIRTLKVGLRKVRVDNNSVTLTYPQDMIQLGKSQIYDLKTHVRTDNGKKKGRVRFEGSDSKKHSFSLRLETTEGATIFNWFKDLEQEIKAKTG